MNRERVGGNRSKIDEYHALLLSFDLTLLLLNVPVRIVDQFVVVECILQVRRKVRPAVIEKRVDHLSSENGNAK